MKKLTYSLFGLSIFLFIVSISIFLIYMNPLQIRVVETNLNLTVGEIGFDLNNTSLAFGKIPIGSSSTRKFSISNSYSFPIKVVTKVNGDIEDFLIFDKFTNVESGEQKFISVLAKSNENSNEGFYSGELEFKILRG